MILVDSSVWIDHLRAGDERLIALLNNSRVLVHPFVTGELACGHIRRRHEVLTLLNGLPQASLASQAEVLAFIDNKALSGRGIGFIDAHLLASTAIEGTACLWTRDQRLRKVAEHLELAFAD